MVIHHRKQQRRRLHHRARKDFVYLLLTLVLPPSPLPFLSSNHTIKTLKAQEIVFLFAETIVTQEQSAMSTLLGYLAQAKDPSDVINTISKASSAQC